MAKIPLPNVTNAATALSNLILVTPNSNKGYQPQPSQGQPQEDSILFNYEGEQVVSLESDITDHFVEDNTAIQDQISLKPETVTTSGYIGELNDVTPPLLEALKFVSEKLTTIGAYQPTLSATALIAYNQAALLYSVAANALNSAVSAWKSVVGGESQNKQQLAFSQFYGYWQNRTLFTVQTPWAIFKDMAIKSLRAIQDDETRMITDFEVTFKKIRFANTITTINRTTSFQGRSFFQSGDTVNLGVQSLAPSTESFSDSIARVA